MNFIKNTIRYALKKLGFKLVNDNSQNFEYTAASKLLEIDYGHLESKRAEMSINAQKKPLPWFTYPAIEYLSQLDLSDKIMLEWGAGNSSLFFSEKVKTIYSIEHNKTWYEQVKQYNISNQHLLFSEINYATEPTELSIKFDIILIDGIKREACSKVVFSLINKGGLIILDNSDRHPDIAKSFREHGFIEVDFHGLGPINDYAWTTSIFMDREINLKPLSIQPTLPIGGGF